MYCTVIVGGRLSDCTCRPAQAPAHWPRPAGAAWAPGPAWVAPPSLWITRHWCQTRDSALNSDLVIYTQKTLVSIARGQSHHATVTGVTVSVFSSHRQSVTQCQGSAGLISHHWHWPGRCHWMTWTDNIWFGPENRHWMFHTEFNIKWWLTNIMTVSGNARSPCLNVDTSN